MASQTEFKIRASIVGLEDVKGLSTSIKNLQQTTRPASNELKISKHINSTCSVS